MYDCFLWNHKRLKGRKPGSVEKLKDAIQNQIQEIEEKNLKKVEANFWEGHQTFVDKNRHHWNNIIFGKWGIIVNIFMLMNIYFFLQKLNKAMSY